MRVWPKTMLLHVCVHGSIINTIPYGSMAFSGCNCQGHACMHPCMYVVTLSVVDKLMYCVKS